MTEKEAKNTAKILPLLLILIAMIILPAGAVVATTISVGGAAVAPGGTMTVPIMINDLPTSPATCGVALVYDPDVVYVDALSGSDFDTPIYFIDNETGWASIGGLQISGSELTGPVKVCNVSLRAVGTAGETSPLNLSVMCLESEGGESIPVTTVNGTFTVLGGTPTVTPTPTPTQAPLSTLTGPSGSIASGQSGTFSVSVANLTDATAVWIQVEFDAAYIAVEDMQLSQGMPEGVFLSNGWGGNGMLEGEYSSTIGYVNAYVFAPAGLTVSDSTPILDITYRTTDRAGESKTVMYGSYGTGSVNLYSTDIIEQMQSGADVGAAAYWDFQFNRTVNGTVTASGGNIPAARGILTLPNGTVTVGTQKTLSLSVQDLGLVDEMMCVPNYNSSIVTFTNIANITVSQTATAAGVMLDDPWLSEYESGSSSAWLFFNNTRGLNTNAVTPLADFKMKAVGDVGDKTEFAAYYHIQKWYYPRENVTISTPFASIVNGEVTIVSPAGADLRGYLVDAPAYIKKYADGHLNFTTTMVIENVGTVGVTEDFKIEGGFGSQKTNITITDDIAAGGKLTYHMTMNVIPGYPETSVVMGGSGSERTYVITTGGDISVGDYSIGLGIDVDNEVEEVNEENNYVTHQAAITKPDLIPVLSTELTAGLPSSETTIQEEVVPGTYNVTYGVRNIGNVYAVATKLNFTNQGASTIYNVPALQPGESWTQTLTGVAIGSSQKAFTVTVNSDGAEVETNPNNNTRTTGYQAYAPVTVILPSVTGSTSSDATLSLWLTNVSAPITAFSVPIKYDPTVCYVSSVKTGSGVTWSSSYGRVTITGTDVNIFGNINVADITLKARADAGRTSVLDSQTDAYVKTTGGNYLNLGITKGLYTQENVSDARVNLYVPTIGSEGYNQTISVSVWNAKTNPVTVDVNVTINGTEIWSASSVPLGAYASKYFTINTWKPMVPGTYEVKAQISGDDYPIGNAAVRNTVIQPFTLEITTTNENYYERYYNYNKTPYVNQYFSLGTYYTANQPARPNATLSIWYPNGTPVDLSQDSPFDLHYYYPATLQPYCYDSTWNSVTWYYIRPKVLGTFDYSISLEARGESDYVNGTIRVLEPLLDIKVVNSTLIADTAGDAVPFDVFNRSPSQGKSVKVTLAAGAEGRTLNGLEQLVGYPHGCPEQTMSPALAILRVKQYYEQRGALTDAMNASFQQNMQDAIARMSAPNGYNAQQLPGASYGDGSGGWAWGKNSRPSAFYTLYPNYVITELLNDNDPEYWGSAVNFTPDEINLNASSNWLINQQKTDGRWSGYGYIYNEVEWTGFTSEKLANDYPYLNDTMKTSVNATLNKSLTWLENHNYNSEGPQAVAHGIYGLVAIREHGLGDAALINSNITALQTKLLNQKSAALAGSYSWDQSAEATAHAVLALNRSGLDADNETIAGGVRYLLGAKGSWGWGSTRTTAVVINTLTQVQPHATINFNVDAELKNGNGDTVWSLNNIQFDNANFQYVYTLSPAQVASLYSVPSADSVAQVIVSGKSDVGTVDEAKLFVEVNSFEKVPQSIAYASIPAEFIDPIATDFFLDVAIPNSGYTLTEGDAADVGFTINNNGPGAVDQTTMIIEIPITSRVNFTGSATGSATAYYLSEGSPVYINHMYNATTAKLYVYPGSDDESQPSITAGASKTFYVPLTFEAYGNNSVEARAYPMYNDTWMAVADGATYIKGYGNITLDAVNEEGAAVLADFYVDGAAVAVNTNITSVERVEGAYAVAIRNETSWVNTTITVTPGDTTTYSAQFVSDRTLPHIAQIEGASGNARVMPPAIEETISNGSTNRWNAATRAMTSFNSSISSSGGRATIAVEIPTVNRTIGTAMVNDTISVLVHNASGWFAYTDFTIENGQLILNNVDTGDIDQIYLDFEGRMLGDVDNNGRIRLTDAITIAQSLLPGQGELTGNDEFYGDVDDSGRIRLQDAISIAQYLIPGQYDDNYQPL
ncbi:CARDB domain-containing protein [Methanoculleus taiwanensis]|nr:CARDB domain-containing protein [Methanoculleus taiwanensis]